MKPSTVMTIVSLSLLALIASLVFTLADVWAEEIPVNTFDLGKEIMYSGTCSTTDRPDVLRCQIDGIPTGEMIETFARHDASAVVKNVVVRLDIRTGRVVGGSIIDLDGKEVADPREFDLPPHFTAKIIEMARR